MTTNEVQNRKNPVFEFLFRKPINYGVLFIISFLGVSTFYNINFDDEKIDLSAFNSSPESFINYNSEYFVVVDLSNAEFKNLANDIIRDGILQTRIGQQKDHPDKLFIRGFQKYKKKWILSFLMPRYWYFVCELKYKEGKLFIASQWYEGDSIDAYQGKVNPPNKISNYGKDILGRIEVLLNNYSMEIANQN